jgi:hypothetical protein
MTKWTIPDELPAQGQQLSELETLRAELHLMKTAGVIEVAVRNQSVSEYMKHWEGRATKAESRIEALDAENARLRAAHLTIIQSAPTLQYAIQTSRDALYQKEGK